MDSFLLAMTSNGVQVPYSVGIIIVSDRAASGEREDECLPAFETALADSGFVIEHSIITSDDKSELSKAIESFINKGLDLIFTSGGTGCAPRDNTPEVTSEFIDKATVGLDEVIREFSRSKTRFATYSRGISGVAKNSFIVNLPGSPKAVTEIVEFLLTSIEHPLRLIAKQIKDCTIEIANDKF